MPLILLVDDEPAITDSLGYALDRAGFATRAARTLADADRALAEAAPALVILDLMLPDGNGLDWLRARAESDRIPVIILSSHDDPVEHIVGLELGADDYIDKPFSPREVVARVRAVLRRAAPATAADEPALVVPAGLRLDPERREAWAGATELGLSRTEFDLLAVFIAAPGRVWERGQLLDRAWGQGVAVTERTVDVHIKALRKKLVAAGLPAETIETVRGVGYRLADDP
ncbi:MAG: response regulator transcription factor [bacterium]